MADSIVKKECLNSFEYESGQEFYNALINYSICSAGNAQESMTANSVKRTDLNKIIPPTGAVEQLVEFINQSELNTLRKIVAYSSILHNILRNNINDQRRLNLKNIKTKQNDQEDELDESDGTLTDQKKNSPNNKSSNTALKNARLDYIPAIFYEHCEFKAAKIAIAYYASAIWSDYARKVVINNIMQNVDNLSMKDIIELFRVEKNGSIPKIKSGLTTNNKKGNDDLTNLIGALFELSAIFKDKSFARFACYFNYKAYFAACKHYIDRPSNPISVRSSYEPLIEFYVKKCVAVVSASQTRNSLLNQFNISPKTVVTHALESLEKSKSMIVSSRNKKIMGPFDAKQQYYVYIGPTNFHRKLCQNYYTQGNVTWWIITYNDCLFDVIGYAIQNVDMATGEVTTIHHLLNDKTWQERLDSVPSFRAKIDISEFSGAELNKYNAGGFAYISYLNNDGLSISYYHNFIAKRGIKRSHGAD